MKRIHCACLSIYRGKAHRLFRCFSPPPTCQFRARCASPFSSKSQTPSSSVVRHGASFHFYAAICGSAAVVFRHEYGVQCVQQVVIFWPNSGAIVHYCHASARVLYAGSEHGVCGALGIFSDAVEERGYGTKAGHHSIWILCQHRSQQHFALVRDVGSQSARPVLCSRLCRHSILHFRGQSVLGSILCNLSRSHGRYASAHAFLCTFCCGARTNNAHIYRTIVTMSSTPRACTAQALQWAFLRRLIFTFLVSSSVFLRSLAALCRW